MATTPNEAFKDSDEEILNRSLAETMEKIASYQADIADVDTRLQSWSLAFWQSLGTLNEDINEKNILTFSNDRLNKEQLQLKREVLLAQIQEHDRILSGITKQLSELQQAARKEREARRQQEFQAEKLLFEKQFRDNPDAFYAEVLPHVPIRQEKTDIVYNNAKKIIAACEAFPSETNRYKLVEAWSVVAQARDRAFEAYRNASQDPNFDREELRRLSEENELFFNGAKHVFSVFVDKGPSGLQGAKFLYDQRKYEQAEYYLNRAVIDQKLIDQLTGEIAAICNQQAQALLRSIPNFLKLNTDVQEQLIKQQAYLIQLSFDMESVPENMRENEYAKLLKYREQLAENIKNAILNSKSTEECDEDYKNLRAGIDKEALSIRKHWYNKQFDKNLQVSLGAGLGIAWLFGAGMPIAAAVGYATSSIISNIDVAEGNIHIHSVERDTGLLQDVATEDFKFIKAAEARWKTLGGSLPEKEVTVNSVQDEIAKKVTDKKTELKEKVKAAGDTYWREHMDPMVKEAGAKAVRLYLAIISMSIIILAVLAVALPVAWPVYVAVAGLALAGFGYLYAKKAANPEKPAATEIGPLVDLTYDAVQRTKKRIGRAIDLVLVQPLRSIGRAFMSLVSPSSSNKIMKFVKAESAAQNANESAFAFSDDTNSTIQKISPRAAMFVKILVKHFEARALQLQQEIKELQGQPKSAYTQAAQGVLNTKVNMMDDDWQKLEAAGRTKNPAVFLEAVDAYLNRTFTIYENEYLQDAKVRKQEGYDLSKERKGMTFRSIEDTRTASTDRAADLFKMQLPEGSVNYAEKQKSLELLLDLKEEYQRFKQGH